MMTAENQLPVFGKTQPSNMNSTTAPLVAKTKNFSFEFRIDGISNFDIEVRWRICRKTTTKLKLESSVKRFNDDAVLIIYYTFLPLLVSISSDILFTGITLFK